MHEGPSVTWREVAEKHHAAFIDEMKTVYDASMRAAVAQAVEEVRKEAQQKLAEVQSGYEQRFESSLQHAREEAEQALAGQRVIAERDRQAELGKLQAEAQQTLTDVKTAFERSREAERERARKEVKQTFAEQWNQVFRRLRLCQTPEAVLSFLAEATAPYAERLVVLSFANDLVHVANSRNVSPADSSAFLPSDAPAVWAVVETRDPVVALAVENELSPVLMRLLKPAIGERAYLFPVRGRQAVIAVAVAHGDVAPGAIELLCEASGFQFDVVGGSVTGPVTGPAPEVQRPQAEPLVATDVPEKTPLVQIAGAPSPAEQAIAADGAPERKAWEELDPAEQKLHLQAQRFARVQVAEMRLYKPEAVRQGLADKNLYHSLKSEMDEARKQFLHRFLSISPSMVDYLHLEILRSLAHDDDRLLGHDYPGPMV